MKEVKPPKKPLAIYYAIVLLVLMLLNFVLVPWMSERQVKEVDYGTFMSMTEDKDIGRVDVESNQIIFTDKDEKQIYKTGLMNDPDLTQRLYDAGAEFSSEIVEQASPLLSFLLSFVLPIVLFVWLGNFMNKKLIEKAGGANSMMFGGVGKSNAKVYVQSTHGIRFADVAGEDEAKENLQEIVDYLHDPKKYEEIGASMPKGILLVGPPGTGKTMLAKAVAGESNVPFFSISGSEFVEMFVGMGASKVRDLFKQAKEKAPCIVFIDEIDAIGQKRNSGQLGGNDEREQTLNQLLTEMDGFEGNSGVIILAATNRPDSLDPALTRPGRFDRRVPVELPDLKGREEILKVHAKKVALAPGIDFNTVAGWPPVPPAQSWPTSSTKPPCGPCASAASRSRKQTLRRASRWSLPAIRRRTPSSPTRKSASWPTMRSATHWWRRFRITPHPCRRSPSSPHLGRTGLHHAGRRRQPLPDDQGRAGK